MGWGNLTVKRVLTTTEIQNDITLRGCAKEKIESKQHAFKGNNPFSLVRWQLMYANSIFVSALLADNILISSNDLHGQE